MVSDLSPYRWGRRSAVVAGTASDSHTWNLIFLQLTLQEHGFRVVNLGPCVPGEELVARCRHTTPDLIVISTVNGHGLHDGARCGRLLAACPELAGTVKVIGGKLTISGRLTAADRARLRGCGFTEVFDHDELPAFHLLLTRLTETVVA